MRGSKNFRRVLGDGVPDTTDRKKVLKTFVLVLNLLYSGSNGLFHGKLLFFKFPGGPGKKIFTILRSKMLLIYKMLFI